MIKHFAYQQIRLLAICIGLSLGLGSSLADEAEYPVEVTGYFRVLGWSDTVRDLRYRQSADRIQTIHIPNGAISSEFRYAGPRDLVFYRQTGVDEEGQPILDPVTAIRLPAGQNQRLLLLFFPTEEGLRVTALDEGGRGYVERGFRFFNMSNQPLALRVGERRGTLPPRSVEDLVAANYDNQTVQIAAQIDGSWQLVYSSRWRPRSNMQTMTFIVPDPDNSGRLQVRRFREASPRRQ